MSKYKPIPTEYKSRMALVMALESLGYTVEQHEEPQMLYAYNGAPRYEKAHIIIRRSQISGSANDLGFRKEETGYYSVLVSEWDTAYYNRHKADEAEAKQAGGYIVAKLKQAYAYADLAIRAKAQGLSIIKKKQANGVVQVVLQGISR